MKDNWQEKDSLNVICAIEDSSVYVAKLKLACVPVILLRNIWLHSCSNFNVKIYTLKYKIAMMFTKIAMMFTDYKVSDILSLILILE